MRSAHEKVAIMIKSSSLMISSFVYTYKNVCRSVCGQKRYNHINKYICNDFGEILTNSEKKLLEKKISFCFPAKLML